MFFRNKNYSQAEEKKAPGSEHVLTSSKKTQHFKETLKSNGIIFILLIGAVGGGLSICRVLRHFHAPFFVVDLVPLVYWCTYGMLVSKIELNSDKKSNYEHGYQDGYADGHEEGLFMSIAAVRESMEPSSSDSSQEP